MYLTKNYPVLTACAALSLAGILSAGEPGKMTREVWDGLPGSQLRKDTVSGVVKAYIGVTVTAGTTTSGQLGEVQGTLSCG